MRQKSWNLHSQQSRRKKSVLDVKTLDSRIRGNDACHCLLVISHLLLGRPLGSGVEFFVDFFQAGDVHVGVDLGGSNVHVAKHFLDTPQVGSAGE